MTQQQLMLTLIEDDHEYWSYNDNQRYWKKKGCRIMTLADLYSMFDNLNKEQLNSLQDKMKNQWLLTSLLNFDGTPSVELFDGKMLSADGRRPQVECLVYEFIPITRVSKTILRHIFNTQDRKGVIIAKLVKFSGKKPKDILFWTPSLNHRRKYPERAASLYYADEQFHINLGRRNYYIYIGCSCGVSF
jgi:hypothetical protein